MSEEHKPTAAKNRILITFDSRDPARWLIRGDSGPLFMANGKGILDGYKQILVSDDVAGMRLDRNSRRALEHLIAALAEHHIAVSQVDSTQINASSLALGGTFGSEVTLIGLDQRLHAVIQDLKLGKYSKLHGLHTQARDDREHPMRFLAADGVLPDKRVDLTQTGAIEIIETNRFSMNKLSEYKADLQDLEKQRQRVGRKTDMTIGGVPGFFSRQDNSRK